MSQPQQFPRLGVSACVWRDGRALIIQRGKPPLPGLWSLPGGHVDAGETVAAAVSRELREETGVTAELSRLVGIFDLIRRDEAGNISMHYAIACFTGPWLDGEARPASDAVAVQWVTPAELGLYRFTPNVVEAIGAARRLLSL